MAINNNTVSNAKRLPAPDSFGHYTSAQIFLEALKNAREVPYNFKWSNGIGHHDVALTGPEAPKVGVGKMVYAITPNGRVVCFIGTRLGLVVVYTRHENWKSEKDPVFVFDMPVAIKQSFNLSEGEIFEDTMELLMGTSTTPNIGGRIDDIYTLCKRAQGL